MTSSTPSNATIDAVTADVVLNEELDREAAELTYQINSEIEGSQEIHTAQLRSAATRLLDVVARAETTTRAVTVDRYTRDILCRELATELENAADPFGYAGNHTFDELQRALTRISGLVEIVGALGWDEDDDTRDSYELQASPEFAGWVASVVADMTGQMAHTLEDIEGLRQGDEGRLCTDSFEESIAAREREVARDSADLAALHALRAQLEAAVA